MRWESSVEAMFVFHSCIGRFLQNVAAGSTTGTAGRKAPCAGICRSPHRAQTQVTLRYSQSSSLELASQAFLIEH